MLGYYNGDGANISASGYMTAKIDGEAFRQLRGSNVGRVRQVSQKVIDKRRKAAKLARKARRKGK